MTSFERLCAVTIGCAVLAACGSSQQEEQQEDPFSADAPLPEETAFSDMTDTLERARGVEDATMQHKQSIDRALEQAEGDAAP